MPSPWSGPALAVSIGALSVGRCGVNLLATLARAESSSSVRLLQLAPSVPRKAPRCLALRSKRISRPLSTSTHRGPALWRNDVRDSPAKLPVLAHRDRLAAPARSALGVLAGDGVLFPTAPSSLIVEEVGVMDDTPESGRVGGADHSDAVEDEAGYVSGRTHGSPPNTASNAASNPGSSATDRPDACHSANAGVTV